MDCVVYYLSLDKTPQAIDSWVFTLFKWELRLICCRTEHPGILRYLWWKCYDYC